MLKDELADLVRSSQINGCVVGVWVAKQDAETQELLNLIANTPNVNLTDALNRIKKYTPDLPFKRTSFVTHMRGTCACQQA